MLTTYDRTAFESISYSERLIVLKVASTSLLITDSADSSSVTGPRAQICSVSQAAR